MARAEHHVRRNTAIVAAEEEINAEYLEPMAIGSDDLRSEISVAMDGTLLKVLEKLELRLGARSSQAEWTRRGLGYSNALFMAAELLLLGSSASAGTLLVEEPEAHLHPQLQARVISLLRRRAMNVERPVQVLLTTHSPNIASTLPLDGLTLVAQGQCFSLDRETTRLNASDYAFLERFLDVTKANLFFARAVLIVEGDAEALLLPALAKAAGFDLERCGVSIVNVGHVGLFRYARIFQRNDGRTIPLKVACVRDLDLVPDHIPSELRGKLKSHGEVGSDGLLARRMKLCELDGGL